MEHPELRSFLDEKRETNRKLLISFIKNRKNNLRNIVIFVTKGNSKMLTGFQVQSCATI